MGTSPPMPTVITDGSPSQFPDRMVGSQASDNPELIVNREKQGYSVAKMSVPSESSTPYVRSTAICEDTASPHDCAEWKHRYGCDTCCIGGNGQRTAAPMTIAEACPSACKPECQTGSIPYTQLSVSALQRAGFDMPFSDFDEDHYPNPDA